MLPPIPARPAQTGATGTDDVLASPVLAVAVIGTVRATIDGRAVPLPSRLLRAVLASIAMGDDHQVTRERLWGLFWAESAQGNAQASLRQIVAKLRRTMDDAGYTGYRFEPTWLALGRDTVRVDVLEVIHAAREQRVHALLRGTRELSDSLLSDVYGLNSDVTDWILGLRGDVLKTLVDALDEALANAALPPARRQDLAEALLSLNPCHEPACRVLMQLRAQAGDPTGAEQAYLDLTAALAERYDVLASQETVEAYVRVKAHLDGAPVPVPEPAPAPMWSAAANGATIPSLAILPFRTPDDPSLASYFGSGLAEEMITALAAFDEISVISRNSTAVYATGHTDVREIGRQLAVRHVLSGTLRRFGEQLRLSAELADTVTGSVVWSYVFTFPNAGLFDVLDNIVARVVGILAPRVRSAELQRARLKRPENMTAYDHMLQGLELLSRLRQEEFDGAHAHLHRAIALDPDYAMAYALAAEWHSLKYGQAWSSDPAHDQREAARLAQEAVDRDPTNARALMVMAHDRAFLFRDYDTALALFHRAEAFSPGSAQVWALSSPTYCYVGQGQEVVRRMQKAKLLSPQDLFSFRQNATLAMAYYTADAFDEALHWGRIALAQNGRYTATPRFLAASAAAAGDLAAARDYAAMLIAVEPEFRVSAYRRRCPFRDAERVDLLCERLLLAGLPE